MSIKQSLLNALIKNSNPEKAVFMSKYMKNVVECRGINAPTVNDIFKGFQKDLKDMHNQQKFDLGMELIKQEFGEDKQIGILILSKVEWNSQLIDQTQSLFKESHIREWVSCDAFCSRVLRNWIKKNNSNAEYMIKWAESDHLWLKRASCVGFITLARKVEDDVINIMYKICGIVVKHPERFSQLGCGWLLRELGIQNQKRAIEFIRSNIKDMSAEGLSYATEKMSKDLSQELKAERKQQKKLNKEEKQTDQEKGEKQQAMKNKKKLIN